MIRPEEFIPLEKELDSLSRISAEEWAENFKDIEAELRGISLQAEADLFKLAPDRPQKNTLQEAE